MPEPITITLANPPPGACPDTLEETFALIRAGLSGEAATTATPYVVQAATPSVDQQGYIWFKLDGNGRPVGIYKFYNGNWRRVQNGVLGEVRLFKGDPTAKFDGTGRGILGGDWDGWALCNGNVANGTTNLSNLFLVLANHDNSAGLNAYTPGVGWQTRVTGVPSITGGGTDYTLEDANLPEMVVTATGKKYDELANQTSDEIIIDDDWKSAPPATPVELARFGQPEPERLRIVPPYYTFALAEFIGYS